MATVNRKYFGPRALGAVVRMLLGFDRRIAEAETAVDKAVEDAEARMNESVAAASEATTAATKIAGEAAGGERMRAEAERGRVGAESGRVESEEERRRNEQSRLEAERSRAAGEADRIEGELERAANERARVSAESTRESKETARQSAETTRQEDETKRVEAEESRERAENERREAESGRATEFESWKTEIDGKADRSELSNIVGTPTGNVIEEIEPTLVADALRKVPQTLTPEEQAQVKDNIGISGIEELIAQAKAIGATHNKSTGLFSFNTLTDITPDEMRNILEWGSYEKFINISNCSAASISSLLPRLRTTIPSASSNAGLPYPIISWMPNGLEVIQLGFESSRSYTIFNLNGTMGLHNAGSLVAIKDKLCPTINNIYIGSKSYPTPLSTLYIHRLNFNLNLANLPQLSVESISYLVANAKNASAIVVTVHPDVYAKLTDESNTEWNQILTAAASKNITFATI